MKQEETILVVDDVKKNLYVFKEALEEKNRKVVTVESGDEALMYLLKNKVDLILMDIQMPGMNGFETVKIMKSNPDLDDIPILFISAVFKSKEFMSYGYSVGAYDYITKPVDMELLKNKADVFLRMRRQQKTLENITESLRKHQEELEMLVEERTAELKEKQAQLIHSAKLSSLGEMATGVAHELNTPLNVILLSAHETRELVEDNELEELPDIQERIIRQVKRCSKIVHHLLTFGRNDKPNIQPTSLEHILDDTLLFFRKKLANDNIRLELKIPDDLPRLNVDAIQIEHIFINLFNNSMNAIERTKGGNITLSAAVSTEGNMIDIHFTDDGSGIPEDVQKKIFEPFFTTKKAGDGTGLGLSISHGIITAHNGTMKCNSEPEQGTEFILQLPMAI